MSLLKRHYYFVYVTRRETAVDVRCPRGGITALAMDECEAYWLARVKALRRFPVRPWECLHVAEVTRGIEKQQVRLLELAKQKADNAFKIMCLS